MNCAIVCTAVRVPFGRWPLSVFLAGGWPWRSLSIRDDKDATEHTSCCPHSRLRPFFVATANFDSRAHWLRFTTESPQPWKSSYCGPGLFSLGQLTFECCVIRTRQKLRHIFFECVKLLCKNFKNTVHSVPNFPPAVYAELFQHGAARIAKRLIAHSAHSKVTLNQDCEAEKKPCVFTRGLHVALCRARARLAKASTTEHHQPKQRTMYWQSMWHDLTSCRETR